MANISRLIFNIPDELNPYETLIIQNSSKTRKTKKYLLKI